MWLWAVLIPATLTANSNGGANPVLMFAVEDSSLAASVPLPTSFALNQRVLKVRYLLCWPANYFSKSFCWGIVPMEYMLEAWYEHVVALPPVQWMFAALKVGIIGIGWETYLGPLKTWNGHTTPARCFDIVWPDGYVHTERSSWQICVAGRHGAAGTSYKIQIIQIEWMPCGSFWYSVAELFGMLLPT